MARMTKAEREREARLAARREAYAKKRRADIRAARKAEREREARLAARREAYAAKKAPKVKLASKKASKVKLASKKASKVKLAPKKASKVKLAPKKAPPVVRAPKPKLKPPKYRRDKSGRWRDAKGHLASQADIALWRAGKKAVRTRRKAIVDAEAKNAKHRAKKDPTKVREAREAAYQKVKLWLDGVAEDYTLLRNRDGTFDASVEWLASPSDTLLDNDDLYEAPLMPELWVSFGASYVWPDDDWKELGKSPNQGQPATVIDTHYQRLSSPGRLTQNIETTLLIEKNMTKAGHETQSTRMMLHWRADGGKPIRRL